ncbi:MAG TPA: hypothetical protein VMX17_04840 [Candidatus Glassbacteria bacterium]|nr:hypothetical protein [Candidatus Glassbacteria bacterium]
MSNAKKIPTEIKKEEMEDALKRSGYLIEQRIFPIFEKFKYYIETNTIYEDPVLKKSREIDFKAWHSVEDKGVNIEFYLFGECINNPFPIVFFSNNVKSDEVYREFALKFTGLPDYYPNEKNEKGPFIINDELPLSHLLNLHSFHHYFQGFLSTQYCSFQYKKELKEWMALHDPNHHDDFQKLTDSVSFEKNRILNYPMKVSSTNKIAPISNIVFFYPIMVVAGDLFECDQQVNNIPVLKESNHIKYKKTNLSYRFDEKYFIDVIKETYLDKYLMSILFEHSKILIEILKNIDVIKRTINSTRTNFRSFHNSDMGKSKF